MPASSRSFFTGRMLFLTPNQCQSTEGRHARNTALRKFTAPLYSVNILQCVGDWWSLAISGGRLIVTEDVRTLTLDGDVAEPCELAGLPASSPLSPTSPDCRHGVFFVTSAPLPISETRSDEVLQAENSRRLHYRPRSL